MKNLEEITTIVWEKRISKNGKEYHVGYHEDAERLETTSDKVPFSIKVDWPATNSSDWIVQDSSFIATTGISRYSLDKDRPWYKYYKIVLNFTAQVHYDYYFTDETGDIYECNVYSNGDHYVQYNSEKPNIIHVKGS
ncbi:conserved hypothetical protein [Flavobacterium sp. 9AF]|uniref:hypothetical protein n=1 Tax=Flavobacterium sp. 9AF TaxID=2653142 RepID=UPI0012F29BD3|nr:hypothetical protein [Flavobacterium sp. 9AF]VXB49759.1 conserved hypothetical protein [Flavobacterium sp. 9AF]